MGPGTELDRERPTVAPFAIDHPSAARAKPPERAMRSPLLRQCWQEVDDEVAVRIRLVALEQHLRDRRRVAEVGIDLLRFRNQRAQRVGQPVAEKDIERGEYLVPFTESRAAAFLSRPLVSCSSSVARCSRCAVSRSKFPTVSSKPNETPDRTYGWAFCLLLSRSTQGHRSGCQISFVLI